MKPILISHCSICSRLGEIETSFSKYGSDDPDRLLPPEASRLVPLTPPDTYDAERHHVRRCPECGIFYRYDQSYEYFVNGSEDEEELRRLTPTEARDQMSDSTYEHLIAFLEAHRNTPDPRDLHFIAKCLTAHYLATSNVEGITTLLRDSRPDIVKGALFFLRWLVVNGSPVNGMRPFESAIREIRVADDESLRWAVAFFASAFSKIEKS